MGDYAARWWLIAACALAGAAALSALGIGVDAGSARPSLNAVHFTNRTVAVKSMRVVGCGTRERSG